MYKTIVVHIDGQPRQDSRVRAAALLAGQHQAHLVGSAATGISWLDYAVLTGSMGAPAPDPDRDFRGLREAAGARLEAFRRAAQQLGVDAVETRVIDDDARYALLLQSRYADLVVLSQDPATPAQADDGGLAPHVRGLPEFLALHGARPVLVVPPSYGGLPIPGRAVVGWDGSLQALRAIGAALPLLRQADSVELALVNPDELSELHGEQPGADMALYLARQGVRVDVVLERTVSTAGDALLALARDCGAGLVVAGAYGHSRYREWVLGGVTRALLARCPVPLLLAH
ncbi:universal stress protein [uncultured Massilia sp.]|uniref:universal stress protein n=1 Tax=uncultured Massilia sp. TaxID=169973 RepID=UPI0025DD9214|nr:universal stress protein [uncultured Massilia sp.]